MEMSCKLVWVFYKKENSKRLWHHLTVTVNGIAISDVASIYTMDLTN